MDAVSFEVDTRKYAGYLAISFVFAAIGTWAAFNGGNWIAWANAVVFGGCAAFFAWQIARAGPPRLVIDDDGLLDRTLGVGVIAWNDVIDAQALHVFGQSFVRLALRDPDVYVQRMKPISRRAAGANKSLGFGDLSLTLDGLRGANADAIAALIRAEAAARRGA